MSVLSRPVCQRVECWVLGWSPDVSNFRLGMSLSVRGDLVTDKINKPNPCLWQMLSWQVLCTQFSDLQALVQSSKVVLKDDAVLFPGFLMGLLRRVEIRFRAQLHHHRWAPRWSRGEARGTFVQLLSPHRRQGVLSCAKPPAEDPRNWGCFGLFLYWNVSVVLVLKKNSYMFMGFGLKLTRSWVPGSNVQTMKASKGHEPFWVAHVFLILFILFLLIYYLIH